MTDAAPESAVPAALSHRATFFRQSGWLMVATIAAGVLTYSVHLLSNKIPASEYGTLITLFSLVSLIPTIPLQMVFTHQTAQALATNRERQLAAMIRAAWIGTFVLCALGAAAVFVFQKQIVAGWHLANPNVLAVLMTVILFSLWTPMFAGVMQGQQNFLWLGWSVILNAVARVAFAVFIVFLLQGQATGIMVGVWIGFLTATAVGAWQTRKLWRGRAEAFDWRDWLKQVAPLMLGFAATQFLFCADTSFVDAYFGAEKTAPYGAAGTMSRALLWLVLPLANVMFPKIVHSTVKSEKNNLMGVALLVTAGLCLCAVAGLWLLGPFAIRLVFPASYVSATLAILPWYAGAMIPLALANVLVNDLLARGKFKIVPWLVLLAAGYGIALTRFHASFVMVLQTLCVFNLLLFAVCALFVWGGKEKVKMADRR